MTFPWQMMYSNPPKDQLRLVFVSAVSIVVRFELLNNTAEEIVIAKIYLDWPSANDAIFNFFKGGSTIWSGEDSNPPTEVESGWSGSVSQRTFAPRESNNIEGYFGLTAQQIGYEMIVTFDNGWVVGAVK